ncbi:TolC family protein [Polyangium aurulentum]|uniref:TolC family protein n=1 Tax=Polyangium aurulentum TaxID=2567896 RepID=UPI0010AE3F8A|nr:TolC family protein [Polyangium aurulentum]UQA58875.1 TolC family protein [Polyangium aurulentum]
MASTSLRLPSTSATRATRPHAALAIGLGCLLTPVVALAQPPAGGAPAAAAPAQPAAAAPVPPVAAGTLPPTVPDRVAVALAPQPGGLTPDEAARIALRTRYSIRSRQAELRAAAARVDQALVNFFPRLSITAGYTRLSPVENQLGIGGGFSVGALQAGVLAPCQTAGPVPGAICSVSQAGESPVVAVETPSFTFPVLLNSYSFVASIAVPISDYVLRISQGYAAATHNENAKRLELEAEQLMVAADAKVAFYNWVRAKGSAAVADDAVQQAQVHLKDAQRTFEVGLISRADVLRLEAQVAAAQQTQAEAGAFANIAEEQLRTLLQLPPGKPLAIGVDVLHGDPAGPAGALNVLQDQALARRLEIRALDETEYSLKENVAITRAGAFPRIDAFADLNYQNPNQRVFPQKDEFRATWDAGVRLSWTINDTFSAIGATKEAQARVEQIALQKSQIKDSLRLEVTSAYSDLVKAIASIEAAERGLVAAEESLRVRQELFRAGRATSTDLVDAEAQVTQARLRRVDARVGLLVARTRLDHAAGRDVPQK